MDNFNWYYNPWPWINLTLFFYILCLRLELRQERAKSERVMHRLIGIWKMPSEAVNIALSTLRQEYPSDG